MVGGIRFYSSLETWTGSEKEACFRRPASPGSGKQQCDKVCAGVVSMRFVRRQIAVLPLKAHPNDGRLAR